MENRLSTLAQHVLTLSYNDIPLLIREKAKDILLDNLGVIVAGNLTPASSIAIKWVKKTNSEEDIYIWPNNIKSNVNNTAFCGGVAGFCLNFADTSLFSISHSGTVIVPTINALSQKFKMSGQEVLISLVAGYDAIEYVARLLNNLGGRMAAQRRGFRPTAVCGALGSAAVAARVLHMKSEECTSALGIALHRGAGLRGSGKRVLVEDAGHAATMWFHSGFAARDGLEAAELAGIGVIEQSDIFDGDGGFLHAHTNTLPENETWQFRDQFAIEGVSIKLHSCAHTLIPLVECVAEARNKYKIKASDVVAMEIHVPQAHLHIAGKTPAFPVDPMSAQLSYPYIAAVTLQEGRFMPHHLLKSQEYTKKLYSLIKCVNVSTSDELNTLFTTQGGWPLRIVIKTREQDYEIKRFSPQGTADKPISRADVKAKFNYLTRPILSEKSLSNLQSAIFDIENVKDFGQVLVENLIFNK